jgi:hypothetical protein
MEELPNEERSSVNVCISRANFLLRLTRYRVRTEQSRCANSSAVHKIALSSGLPLLQATIMMAFLQVLSCSLHRLH